MEINQIVLYTDDLEAMDRFYKDLLGLEAVALSENYHIYPANGKTLLGVNLRDTVVPEAGSAVGGSELVIDAPDRVTVDTEAKRLGDLGIAVTGPLELPYGYVIVVEDPAGHRIRLGHFPNG